MWIQGSTLSIIQRSFLPARELSAFQAEAQELATLFIQSYGARHAKDKALEFIHEHSPTKPTIIEEHLSFALATNPLSIPTGYGVKGGAARESLVAALSVRAARQPRDIDLVRRGHHRSPADDSVARQLMGRDFELGARVELIRSLGKYLSSRDLTINEVVTLNSTVSTSFLCVLDTMGQVIRPSRYRGGTLHRKPGLHGQSLLKMVRLYAEGMCSGENWSILGIPEEIAFSEFDLAVHLNKAFQRGRSEADAFLHTCELLSLLGASSDRVRDALQKLEHLRHGERGLFPDVPAHEWDFLSTLPD